MEIKIIIATHKQYKTLDNDLYMPLQVGSEGKAEIGFKRDNTGDNISYKNPFFCELTGMYWAWKNLKSDYKGLVHYRRYFKGELISRTNSRIEKAIDKEELLYLFKKADIILPKKRNYYIESLYSHYSNTHNSNDLDQTRIVLSELYPDYLDAYDKVMKKSSGHMFNMCIMKSEIFDSYCKWLFDILFKLEEKINIDNYSSFESRLFGRVSELLMDVWINENGYKYIEVPVLYLDKVNWIKKGFSFLGAKIFKIKYKKSF